MLGERLWAFALSLGFLFALPDGVEPVSRPLTEHSEHPFCSLAWFWSRGVSLPLR